MELIELIKRDFSELIKKYNLTISSPFPNIVELRNEHCKVQIQLERGIEVYITFINPKTNKKYELMNLVFFRGLMNKEKIRSNSIFEMFAKKIELYYSDILLGDFSWSDDYDVFMKQYNPRSSGYISSS